MKKLVVIILIIMLLLMISGCTSKSGNLSGNNNDYGQDPEEIININMVLYEILPLENIKEINRVRL